MSNSKVPPHSSISVQDKDAEAADIDLPRPRRLPKLSMLEKQASLANLQREAFVGATAETTCGPRIFVQPTTLLGFQEGGFNVEMAKYVHSFTHAAWVHH